MSVSVSRPGNTGQSFRKESQKGYLWFLVIAIVFCQLLAHTWIRNRSTQTLVEISRKQVQLNSALSYNRALGVERGRLKSETRVIPIAKNKLGLHQDVFQQIVYLQEYGI